jgi:hypothetical protein
MTIHKDARIARRAYEIWEKAGRPHGHDRQHWLQATAEIEETSPVVSGDAPIEALPSPVVNGDARIHATASTVVSGDAPVHGPTPIAAKPRAAPPKAAMIEPAKMKAAPKARTAPARTKAPTKTKGK